MPYISINTANKLSTAAIEEIKAELGRLITVLPGKSERSLMLDFCDGHDMYLAGNKMQSCAYINVKLYGESPQDAKKAFAEGVFKLMETAAGVKNNELYLNFDEYANWASNGSYR